MPDGSPATVAELNRLTDEACIAALAPLFEGAPRFLARLCAARPFEDAESLFAAARAIGVSMPEVERIELIDAHPRLGAPPSSVSAASFVEQGYDREAADAQVRAVDQERDRVATELERLNRAYESRFGFHYCVFVAGRTRAELLPAFESALAADRDAEMSRAVAAVIDIAADRWPAGTTSQRRPTGGLG